MFWKGNFQADRVYRVIFLRSQVLMWLFSDSLCNHYFTVWGFRSNSDKWIWGSKLFLRPLYSIRLLLSLTWSMNCSLIMIGWPIWCYYYGDEPKTSFPMYQTVHLSQFHWLIFHYWSISESAYLQWKSKGSLHNLLYACLFTLYDNYLFLFICIFYLFTLSLFYLFC